MSEYPSRFWRRCLAIVCTVGLGAAALPAGAGADQVGDAQAAAKKAADYLDYLDLQQDQVATDAEDAQAALERAQQAIADSQARIAELDAQLAVIRDEVGRVALDTFISGDQASATGSLLTGSGTVTEVVEREEYAKLALAAGQSSTDELESVLNSLDAEKKKLEQNQAAASNWIDALTQKKAELEKLQKTAQDYQDKMDANVREALAERERQRQAELLANQQAEQAAAAARIRNSNSGRGGNGGGGTGGNGGGNTTGGTSTAADNGANADAGGGDSSSSSGGSSRSGGSTGAGRNVPDPSPGSSGAVAAALSQVGVGYRYATASPGDAFDCSGLTAWAWGQAGVSLPHQSRDQYAALPHVSPTEAQPGDLVFFYNPISHVGLYVGGGMMVDAANPRLGVRKTAVNWGKVVGVGRPG